MGAVLTEVVVDAEDPHALAAWWAEVLGWRTIEADETGVEIGAADGATPTLVFVPVPEAKAGKNRIHLDVNPTGCDQDEELFRLRSLGARDVDVGQGEQTWHVLADPEGNEFCLLRRRVG
ncbi:MAG TPA: VOC family protein [Acidimicrobiales bacterium]|nr:VOC family protein [Acidimicrobiales bacterium]